MTQPFLRPSQIGGNVGAGGGVTVPQVQALLNAGIEPHEVTRTNATRGVMPTTGEAAVDANDVVTVYLNDGTIEIWEADAAGALPATASETVEPNSGTGHVNFTRNTEDFTAPPTLAEFGAVAGTDDTATISFVDELTLGTFAQQDFKHDGTAWVTIGETRRYDVDRSVTAANMDIVKHKLFYQHDGASNDEGFPVASTGGTPFPGPALDVEVIGHDSYVKKAYDLVDNTTYRKTRSNTVNPTTAFAQIYQAAKTADNDVAPQIVMARTAFSGSSSHITAGGNRWNPARRRGLSKTNLWDLPVEGAITTNTSLYHLSQQVATSAVNQIIGEGKTPVYMGLMVMGIGGEALRIESASVYGRTLESMRESKCRALGLDSIPMFVVRIRSTTYDAGILATLNQEITDFAAKYHDVHILDPESYGINPIYFTDGIHYLSTIQEAFQQEIYNLTIGAGKFGYICRDVQTANTGGASAGIKASKSACIETAATIANNNVGDSYTDGAADAGQMATIGGVDVTITSPTGIAESNAGGVLVGSSDGAGAEAFWTIDFNPPQQVVEMMMNNFLNASAGRNRRLDTIAPEPVSAAAPLDYSGGILSGTGGSTTNDGLVRWEDEAGISQITFRLYADAPLASANDGPRISTMNFGTLASKVMGFKTIDQDGNEVLLDAAGEVATGADVLCLTIPEVDENDADLGTTGELVLIRPSDGTTPVTLALRSSVPGQSKILLD